MATPMRRVNELVSAKMGNYLTNFKSWNPVTYNVLEYGVVGGGEIDDTAALQSLVDLAISEGRKAIYFPAGEYYVTSLTNADQVVFFGDNASFVGGYTGIIYQMGDWATNEQLADITIDVKTFGAKGDGDTDDTEAIQAAFDYADSVAGGNTGSGSGYIGWYTVEVYFPSGTYKCGKVTIPDRIKISGSGQSVIVSNEGSGETPSGYFVDNVVTFLHVKHISFLYFDTCFRIPTNNIDFSFVTFEECSVSKTNTFVDTVSYALSRSTTFKMSRCKVTYDVETLGKIYTDKAHFEGNWFMHTVDSIFLYLDSYATFKDNVWVPLTPGTSKAYVYFFASDSIRSLLFTGERFGGEAGSCPIVIVGDVNAGGSNDAYRNQGISFDNCYLSSNSTYNPDEVTGVRACVILQPTVSPNKSINYVSFRGCSFLPDLSGGVIQTYNTADVSDLLGSDFIIEFDYTSAVSATRGSNKLASADLLRYVDTKLVVRKTSQQKSGKIPVVDTATTGQKKATFKINRTWPGNYHTPITYLVTTIGQGDTNINNLAYGYTSVYILTISGGNASTTRSKIAYTKLHGATGGVSLGANADIISAHWGTGDTGSDEQTLSGTETEFDVTIAFGTRVQVGNIYVQPLYDFSLLT